ncbi:MAG: hypothetical protein ACQETL_01315 [Bacteroidota bacterium]
MKHLIWFIFIPLLLIQCASTDEEPLDENGNSHDAVEFADVTAVSVTQSGNAYNFNVTIKSPDTGCDQYADWWEVVSEDEKLIYRRVLLHSHVDEQPFSRSGGLVEIAENENVWVRAHMNNSGYGGKIFYGSIKNGFEAKETPDDFALDLEEKNPLPEDCAF